MKKITLSILVVLFTLSAAIAQENVKKERRDVNTTERASKVADRLQMELVLSKEVRDKVYELNLVRFNELKALRDKYAGDMENHKPEVQAVRKEYKAALNELLTPEQAAKLQSKSAERKERKTAPQQAE